MLSQGWAFTPEEQAERKFRRAYQRLSVGGKIGRLVLVTLTTPESFQGGLHRAWRLFCWRARRRGLLREYYAVREWNEKHTCKHLHVLFRTEDELGVQAVRACWLAAVNASESEARELNSAGVGSHAAGASGEEAACLPFSMVWTHHKWVRDEKGMFAYLAKYLLKSGFEEPRKRGYWYALNWVVRGYAGISKASYACGLKLGEMTVREWRAAKLVGLAQLAYLDMVGRFAHHAGVIVGRTLGDEVRKAYARCGIRVTEVKFEYVMG